MGWSPGNDLLGWSQGRGFVGVVDCGRCLVETRLLGIIKKMFKGLLVFNSVANLDVYGNFVYLHFVGPF